MSGVVVRATIAAATVAMLLGGCATAYSPGEAVGGASPPGSSSSTNFAYPQPLLQRYPDIGRGGP
jgi:hypothetical protein